MVGVGAVSVNDERD